MHVHSQTPVMVSTFFCSDRALSVLLACQMVNFADTASVVKIPLVLCDCDLPPSNLFYHCDLPPSNAKEGGQSPKGGFKNKVQNL